jgi:hypothetical protein
MFHSMMREKYAVFTVPPLSPLLDYFGPDAMQAANAPVAMAHSGPRRRLS